MPQQEKTEASSPKKMRTRSKAPPMSDSEKQMAAVARKRIAHKEIKVFVRNPLKDLMVELCHAEGITQAQFIERLLEDALKAQGLLK
ncbi:replication regulatory protein RepA [Klebsiella sp. BIGb0407]|uniref:replication regulatory protein RepA n=1 Tax=Klebsiella sp. BIGb0407 TaxID=2940603 RepID=UPI00216A6985|nr:replication regulatory protein RepA [Klebsiella sp. BIGb0407]MCS3434251.1 hypothetical protein [Klebsiella sp. BIGb0407]